MEEQKKITALVAVASRSFSTHPVLRKEIKSVCLNVKFNEGGKSLVGNDLAEFLAGAHYAVCALERIDGELLSQLPELRVVSKYGVGLDMLDLKQMEARSILLGWTPGVNALSVAELTVGFMIDLLHRVPEASALVRNGKWRQIRGRQLTGKTVGIIGCGNVGKEVVRLLQPFRCKILVNDVRNYPEFYKKNKITTVSLEYLLMNADIISVHVPLDKSTRGMLNADKLALLKDSSILINNARGGIIDDNVALALIEAGRLAGLACDVLEFEPPALPSKIVDCSKCIVTPHIGGSSEDAVLAMGRAAIEGLFSARPVSSYSELGSLINIHA